MARRIPGLFGRPLRQPCCTIRPRRGRGPWLRCGQRQCQLGRRQTPRRRTDARSECPVYPHSVANAARISAVSGMSMNITRSTVSAAGPGRQLRQQFRRLTTPDLTGNRNHCPCIGTRHRYHHYAMEPLQSRGNHQFSGRVRWDRARWTNRLTSPLSNSALSPIR